MDGMTGDNGIKAVIHSTLVDYGYENSWNALVDSMSDNGISGDDSRFFRAIMGSGRRKFGIISPVEAKTACAVWVGTGNPLLTFIAAHMRTCMEFGNIRDYDGIYDTFIRRALDDGNLEMTIPVDADKVGCRFHRHGLMGYSIPIMDNGVMRHVSAVGIPYDILYYESSAKDYVSVHLRYSRLRRAMGLDAAYDAMSSLGYDVISRIIDECSASLRRLYHLGLKDVVMICMELADDPGLVDWLLDVLHGLNADESGTRPLQGVRITSDWVRENHDYTMEFLFNAPTPDGVNIEEYQEKVNGLLHHIQVVTGLPDDMYTIMEVNGSNQSLWSSEHVTIRDIATDEETGYMRGVLNYRWKDSSLLNSMHDMLYGETSISDFTDSHLRLADDMVDAMMNDVPDAVWRLMNIASSYRVNDDDGLMIRNGSGISRVSDWGSDCGSYLAIYRSYKFPISYGGFLIPSGNVVATDSLRNARRILSLHDVDAMYRYAIVNILIGASLTMRLDMINNVRFIPPQSRRLHDDIWEYVRHGSIPDDGIMRLSDDPTCDGIIPKQMVDRLHNIPQSLRDAGGWDVVDIMNVLLSGMTVTVNVPI